MNASWVGGVFVPKYNFHLTVIPHIAHVKMQYPPQLTVFVLVKEILDQRPHYLCLG